MLPRSEEERFERDTARSYLRGARSVRARFKLARRAKSKEAREEEERSYLARFRMHLERARLFALERNRFDAIMDQLITEQVGR